MRLRRMLWSTPLGCPLRRAAITCSTIKGRAHHLPCRHGLAGPGDGAPIPSWGPPPFSCLPFPIYQRGGRFAYGLEINNLGLLFVGFLTAYFHFPTGGSHLLLPGPGPPRSPHPQPALPPPPSSDLLQTYASLEPPPGVFAVLARSSKNRGGVGVEAE